MTDNWVGDESIVRHVGTGVYVKRLDHADDRWRYGVYVPNASAHGDTFVVAREFLSLAIGYADQHLVPLLLMVIREDHETALMVNVVRDNDRLRAMDRVQRLDHAFQVGQADVGARWSQHAESDMTMRIIKRARYELLCELIECAQAADPVITDWLYEFARERGITPPRASVHEQERGGMGQTNKSHAGGAHKRPDGSDEAVKAEHAVQRDPDIRGIDKGRREAEKGRTDG